MNGAGPDPAVAGSQPSADRGVKNRQPARAFLVACQRTAGLQSFDLAALESVARLVGYALHHVRMYDDIATMKHFQREKAKFMRIMLHELKSPVSGALMMVDVMRTSDMPGEKRTQLLDRVSARLGALLDTVKETLELSRVASGEILGDIVVLNLAKETPPLCKQYEEMAAQKGLTFTLDVPETELPVRIDVQGYRLIVSNLVSNAVKYTQRGAVTVRLAAMGETVELSVTDSGIGIPEKDIPHLFTEFYRASNAMGSSIGGTGIGLASVKGIAERFGAQLTLATRENEGTTFTVKMPRHTPRDPLSSGTTTA